MHERNLSIFPSEQLPDFVRVDHPTFVAFLEAYFEWLETQRSDGMLRSPADLKGITDVDETMDSFITHFKETYLKDFPTDLAVDTETGTMLNEKLLIKNIRKFYEAKGTEKSFQFLFRVLYDVYCEMYYPKEDVLRTSHGKWIQRKSIRVTSTLMDKIYESVGKQIVQKTKTGSVIAAAYVSEVNVYQEGPYKVSELFIETVNGDFEPFLPIYFSDNSGLEVAEQFVYPVIGKISISSGGSKYVVGDEVKFTTVPGDGGVNGSGTVSQVSSTGAVQKVKIDNFGVNYKKPPTITVVSDTGSGFAGTVTVVGMANAEGYYANNDGLLSSNKVLQDNHFYQDFSYVIKSEVTVDRYRNIIKKLIHPVGLAFFGDVVIKRCAFADIETASILERFEVPFIGSYAPYTFNTSDNMQDWFKSSTGTSQGYDPNIHDPLIQATGTAELPKGNPISNKITFTEGITFNATLGFPPGQLPPTIADPFWICYKHPNRKITDEVVALIEFEQLKDFYGTPSGPTGEQGDGGWEEWTMEDPAEQAQWYKRASSEGSAYAILKYSDASAFRKIVTGEFFNMRIGEVFDCRVQDLTQGTFENQIEALRSGTPDPIVGTEKETGPFAISGYYPLYNTSAGARGSSPIPNVARSGEKTKGYHRHIINGVEYFMPNGLTMGVSQFHGSYYPGILDPKTGEAKGERLSWFTGEYTSSTDDSSETYDSNGNGTSTSPTYQEPPKESDTY